jgi:hypothetical protein
VKVDPTGLPAGTTCSYRFSALGAENPAGDVGRRNDATIDVITAESYV